MDVQTRRPTRREERRAQTVAEIKALAMEQVRLGGPDAVSLSGIVREMAMSPAAVYRYFASRDALLADLVVDAYDALADFLESLAAGRGTADERLVAVLGGARAWAGEHPNVYRLVFQTSSGSGRELAPARAVPAATRSMAVLVGALSAVDTSVGAPSGPSEPDELDALVATWGERSGMSGASGPPGPSPLVLRLALTAWTRLHGIISLELDGHLGAAGVDPGVLYAAEVATIRRTLVAPTGPGLSGR